MRGLVILASLVAGGLHALTFAPDPLPASLLPLLQVVLLAVLAWAVWRAPTVRQAVGYGWLFGFANFGVGLYWVFISLHVYGQMHLGLSVMAVLVLSAGLALFPALAAGFTRWLVSAPDAAANGSPTSTRTWYFVLAWAVCWGTAEWLRGTVFTGFPWLNIGYAHVDGPLAGWAPLLGVYAVATAAAASAALLMGVVLHWRAGNAWRTRGLLVLAVLWGVGLGFSQNPWGVHAVGEPLALRLVQGNVSQSNKFDPNLIVAALDRHVALAGQPSEVPEFRPDAVILPETAIPVFQDQLPVPLWQPWRDVAGAWGGTVVTGIALHEPGYNGRSRYTNSVIGFDSNVSPFALIQANVPWRYDKQHLVPFGEFVPPGFRWFVNAMFMPMGDFDRGERWQHPFEMGEQRVAFNICYEDIFGEELLPRIRQSPDGDPGATILANVSNLGWFGESWALRQHLHMARMRSIETARPSVRSTNTGVSAVIDRYGKVQHALPAHEVGVLDVTVRGTTGYTPYVRWGNAAVLVILWLPLAWLVWRRVRAPQPPPVRQPKD